MSVSVDDKDVFTEYRENNLSKLRPVVITSHEYVVDVKTFKVTQANDPTGPNIVEQELKNLNGTWLVVSRKVNGKTVEPSFRQLQIAGNRMIFSHSKASKDSSYSFLIDPTKDPKTMDRTTAKSVVQAIYRLDGDLLTIADSPAGASTRPTDFASSKGSNINLIVWRRK